MPRTAKTRHMIQSKMIDISTIHPPIPEVIKKFDPSYVTRYSIVTEIIKQLLPKTKRRVRILDVGGYNGASSVLLSDYEVTVLDVFEDDTVPNYVQYGGGKMPFVDSSFDAVISCDTLEHVKPELRDEFVGEISRVSKEYIILCAPFGTPEVEAAELRTDKYYQGMTGGESYIWLKEHREYGLPKKSWFERKLQSAGLRFTTFDHTSLFLWEEMLRTNFFLATNLAQVAPGISKKLNAFNEEYLQNFTFEDFPERGYRTFYVCSKNTSLEVKTPPFDQKHTDDFINRQLYLSGKYAQEVSKRLGKQKTDVENYKRESKKLLEDVQKLDQAYNSLRQHLESVVVSKSYRLARKISRVSGVVKRKR